MVGLFTLGVPGLAGQGRAGRRWRREPSRGCTRSPPPRAQPTTTPASPPAGAGACAPPKVRARPHLQREALLEARHDLAQASCPSRAPLECCNSSTDTAAGEQHAEMAAECCTLPICARPLDF